MGQAAELVPDAPVEVRSVELGEPRGVVSEADLDHRSAGELADVDAVEDDVDRRRARRRW